jgi:hypothetical protein
MASDRPDRAVSSLVAGIRIKNTEIGWVQGFRIQESFTQFPIDALGDPYTKYHELTRIRVSGSFDRIRIYNKPLSHLLDNDLWLRQGSPIEFVRQYVTSFVVYNIYTGEDLYTVEQFKPTDRSITLTTDGVIMENCSFVARRMTESSPRRTVDGQEPGGTA